ncbi:ThiJ/PfpI family protein, partial [Coniochaeta hoffmannii]
MSDSDEAFVTHLRDQSWSLYGVGIFIILLRLFARLKRLGPRNLQPDDYLMLLVAGLYTALIVCLNEIAQGGGSNLYEPTLYPSFTPLEIEERVRGSKIVVASEQAMLNVIYAVKASMLVMYTRLTLGLATQRLVRYLACYTLAGYLASQVAFFAACVPFAGYWSVPPVAEQCATLARYSVVQAVFNISSDVAMLSVPLPLVLRTSMPARQKAVLGVIFGMGLFVVTAAVLTKVYNLGDVYSEGYML